MHRKASKADDAPALQTDEQRGSSLLQSTGRSVANSEFHSPQPDGYQRGRHRFVVVLGTVMSGLGKGIFSSSLAKLCKDKGLSVAPIKLEGYLNIDSGTLNPYRHGEVFVLDDGTECDMDLGTYERMLDQNLSHRNFTTAGKIYTEILAKERQGGFLGRDVQMIPHVTGEVKRQLRELAMTGGPDGGTADIVFVEVGGTVGDYENGFYIEALRELAFEEGAGSVCFVALTYILEPKTLGEQKSKAAQLGIKRLMETGIQPHMIACRADHVVTDTVQEKIAMFSNVPPRRVFSMHDRDSIYSIPDSMRSEGLDREVLTVLDLHHRVDSGKEDAARASWQAFTGMLTGRRNHSISIGILGKYAALRDAYASIDKAIEHASSHLSAETDVRWIDVSDVTAENVADRLQGINGVIVPGGFGERGVEGKIACVEHVRTTGVPFLGICLGFQVAVIEFARNAANLKDAHSTEFISDVEQAVISELPDQKAIEGLGGTMRLGGQDVQLTAHSLASFLYGDKTAVRERFRHRYEVDPRFIDALTSKGLIFSGVHPSQPIMQIMELPRKVHPYFIGGQFHPELTSRPLAPHPMFCGLLANAIAHAHPDIAPAAISTRWLRSGDEPDHRPSDTKSVPSTV